MVVIVPSLKKQQSKTGIHKREPESLSECEHGNNLERDYWKSISDVASPVVSLLQKQILVSGVGPPMVTAGVEGSCFRSLQTNGCKTIPKGAAPSFKNDSHEAIIIVIALIRSIMVVSEA